MTQEGGTILVVDDEQMVTGNLELLLRMESTHEAVVFNRPEDAVAHLEQHEVDVVLSDFMMPGLNGLQLLNKAKELRPTASRLLLTGYADKDSAIKAINDVGLFYYLEKPWDNGDLLLILRNAVERSRLLRSLADRTGSLNDMREQIWKLLI
ncbi:hypothetical protein ABI59_23200 [Acidobacteria bacterium Mor1]|nr:hypothetical protein ABI59_23200 [Acidobacteria bacterium Mor1]